MIRNIVLLKGLMRSRPQQLTLCRSLHAEALQATASDGLVQGPYVAARVRFEPATLRSKIIDSTNAPPHPTMLLKGNIMLTKYNANESNYNAIESKYNAI